MRKFGYLPSSSTATTDTLYHEEAIIAGIKNMQKYGALNQTGVLDSATIKVSEYQWTNIFQLFRSKK